MSDGRFAMRFEIDARYLQGAGVVQGGVVAGMLGDTARTLARSLPDDGAAATVLETLDIAFHRPAPVGGFVATAAVTRKGRSTVHVEAELHDAQGRLIATATASCSRRPDAGR